LEAELAETAVVIVDTALPATALLLIAGRPVWAVVWSSPAADQTHLASKVGVLTAVLILGAVSVLSARRPRAALAGALLERHLRAHPPSAAVAIVSTSFDTLPQLRLTVEVLIALSILKAPKDAVSRLQITKLACGAPIDSAPLSAIVGVGVGVAVLVEAALDVAPALGHDTLESLRVTAQQRVFVAAIHVLVAAGLAQECLEVTPEPYRAPLGPPTPFDAVAWVPRADKTIFTIRVVRAVPLRHVGLWL
jgi:hypothetical protein